MAGSNKKDDLGRGPWWVQDKAGNSFAWNVAADIESGELTLIKDESPLDRNGGYRAAEPANPVDPATTPQGELL